MRVIGSVVCVPVSCIFLCEFMAVSLISSFYSYPLLFYSLFFFWVCWGKQLLNFLTIIQKAFDEDRETLLTQTIFSPKYNKIENCGVEIIRSYFANLRAFGDWCFMPEIYITKLIRELKKFNDLLNLYFLDFENRNKITPYTV